MLLLATFILVLSPLAAAKPTPHAAAYTFDGFKLGDSYGEKIMTRAPYERACDNDAVDNKTRRAMVYSALPCRDMVFPNQTTVVFLLPYGKDKYNQPLEAFAWLFGSYFDTRTDFPHKPGDDYGDAVKTFGPQIQAFGLGSTKAVTVHVHAGDIHLIEGLGRILGIVVGPMPVAADNEQWLMIEQMYQRYTPQVLPGPVDPAVKAKTEKACRLARACCGDVNTAHAATLGGGEALCQEELLLTSHPTAEDCDGLRKGFRMLLEEKKLKVPESCRAP